MLSCGGIQIKNVVYVEFIDNDLGELNRWDTLRCCLLSSQRNILSLMQKCGLYKTQLYRYTQEHVSKSNIKKISTITHAWGKVQ